MKKEIKEIKEILDKIEKLTSKKGKDLAKELEKAMKEECTIFIEKGKNGKAKTCIEGRSITILLTLAGLEKTILDKLNPPAGLWDAIKDSVDTTGAE